jgi:hypothetical protein
MVVMHTKFGGTSMIDMLAYMKLYGLLAGVRPSDDSIATEVRKRLDRDLTYWYHEVSGA